VHRTHFFYSHQISFVWIFLQEWIQGKGVLQSIVEGDVASNISLEMVCLMLLFVSFQFCMLPFEQNVKIRVPREWLDNPTILQNVSLPPNNRPQRPKRKEPEKPDVRKWNLNGEKAPYGFDVNAEVWNGRVAMVRKRTSNKSSSHFVIHTQSLDRSVLRGSFYKNGYKIKVC
jgi:hypothetical protein